MHAEQVLFSLLKPATKLNYQQNKLQYLSTCFTINRCTFPSTGIHSEIDTKKEKRYIVHVHVHVLYTCTYYTCALYYVYIHCGRDERKVRGTFA